MPDSNGKQLEGPLLNQIRSAVSGDQRISKLLKDRELGVVLSDGEPISLLILPSSCSLDVSGTYESPHSKMKLKKPKRCKGGSSTPSNIKRFIQECVGKSLPAEGFNDFGVACAWLEKPNYDLAVKMLEKGLEKTQAGQKIADLLKSNLDIVKRLQKPGHISFPLDALPKDLVAEIEEGFERIRVWDEPGLRVLSDSERKSLPWAE